MNQSLKFEKVKHQVNTTDAQPSNEAGGIMVMVTGALLVCGPCVARETLNGQADLLSKHQVDEEQRPMNYSQVFQLLPDGQGGYFVFNDVFRLIY